MKLPWPRFRRLTKRAQFTACYDGGTRHYTRYFVVFARQAEADKPAPFPAAHNTAASPAGISGGSCCMGHAEFTRVHADEAAHGLSVSPQPEHVSPAQKDESLGEPSSFFPWGRLGLAVTKKCGNAVQRNRIKRVLRAFFRLHQDDMPAMDIVVTPKRHLRADQINLALVERDLAPILANLRKSFPVLSPANGTHADLCLSAKVSAESLWESSVRQGESLSAPTKPMLNLTGQYASPHHNAAPAATSASLKSVPACGGTA